MNIKGQARNGSYVFECGDLSIKMKKLNFKMISEIESRLKPPPAPVKIVSTPTGTKSVKKDDPEYDETVSRFSMLRLAVIFYFSLDDDAVELSVERREASGVDEKWATEVFDELVDYLTFEEFQTLSTVLLSKLGISVGDVTEASEDFLSGTS